ncbi:hypothetical protein FisN_4Lh445 [Fistulifera solaris]|uniref:Uncharacterized protein n=1 Tax=Fistulifera solaris TaxID=1519565 RepID=A0A1Z5KEE9_FISSO|nr:hypothetical protein FisN_4Lh445 [Fistulifera solaris]|eukprot:GAX24328.1 hypothetical protein FisN_4Lh445 [Fistulifera solaris]
MSGRVPVVYQIDFTAVAAGKRVASSKRRVRWRFGFANMSALSNGEVGTACRGEEHDVTLIWSLTSGKRTILFDGHEVHFSIGRMGIFDHSWTIKNNHVLKVIAHASPPLSPTPGFRQYDFFVDGQSFFSFPKVYRLGMAANDPRAVATSIPMAEPRRSTFVGSERITSLEMPTNPDEEEAYLQEAIRQSLEDDQVKTGGGGDLLDLGSDTAPAQPPVALPHSTNTAWGGTLANTVFIGAPVPALPSSTSDPWSTAITPVPNAAFPWAASPTPAIAATEPWGAPPPPAPPTVSADSWGAAPVPAPVVGDPWGSTMTPLQPQTTPVNPYAKTPSTNGFPYGSQSYDSSQYPPASNAPAPSAQNGGLNQYSQPLSGQPSYTQSAAAPYNSQTPVPSGTWTAPPAISTSYDNPEVPSSVTPLAQQTPSSLGFGSPAPTFSGFSPSPVKQQPPPAQEQAPSYPPNGQSDLGASAETKPVSLFDQTFAKLANVDSFSLTSKKDEPAANPFASTSISDNRSLANIQKTKAPPSKEIMKSYQPSSMVVSSQQNSYGSQYGIQQGGQEALGSYGQQQQPVYGQPNQQSQYGQPISVPQYGQAPATGQFHYGQPAPVPGYAQQPPYGQQQPQFAQQPGAYGQQPPFVQQQGFNF